MDQATNDHAGRADLDALIAARSDGYPRWALCGHGRCGKDTAGLWLAAHTPMRFAGSTSHYLWPYVVAKTGRDPKECWENRHRDRELWYETGEEVRAGDPLTLLRKSLTESHVVAGCRSREEIEAALEAGLLDLVIWIDREVPVDPTLKYGPELADVILPNRGTIAEFERRLCRLVRQTRIPLIEPQEIAVA